MYHYEEKKQAMAARRLANEAPEGGVMSHVRTNLVSRAQSAKKAVRELIIPSENPPREASLIKHGRDYVTDKLERSAEKLRQTIKELEERGETPPH